MRIITDLNILKQRSEPVISIDSEEVKSIIKKLEESLDTTRGLGLTAIQIGIKTRVAIIRMPKLTLNLINPVITEKFDKYMFKEEKCLSILGLAINTTRYMDVTLQNGDGKIYSFTGLEAVVVMHELSHMNGRTIMDDKWRKRR